MDISQQSSQIEQEHLQQLEQQKRNRYAKMLLQSYRERPSQQQNMTIDEYLTWYAEKIGSAPKKYIKKQDKQRVAKQYCLLKKELAQKLELYHAELKSKKEVIKPYNQFKELIGKKQLATLRAMNSQLSAYEQTSAGEELNRINKIIQNGAWGCMDKLQEKLTKLRQLQSSIQ